MKPDEELEKTQLEIAKLQLEQERRKLAQMQQPSAGVVHYLRVGRSGQAQPVE